MKKISYWILLLFISFLNTKVAFAIKVNSLYQANLQVSTQSTEERTEAVKKGLGQVLMKVTGTEQILSNPRIKSSLETAENMLQEFGYTETTDQPGYRLDLQFDHHSIDQLLQNASAPIWGANRPLILVWCVFENPALQQEILANDSSNPIVHLLKQTAEEHGLPILFPIMDLTDQHKVSVGDIQNALTTNLQAAAKRYASDALLIGKWMIQGGHWVTQWKLLLDNEPWDWTLTGSFAEVSQQIIDLVAQTLSTRYAVVSTDHLQNTLLFKVTGIERATDFQKLMQYLQHLTTVAEVNVAEVSGNEVKFNILLRAQPEHFIKVIGLGQKLAPVPDHHSQIIYQWNPSHANVE